MMLTATCLYVQYKMATDTKFHFTHSLPPSLPRRTFSGHTEPFQSSERLR